MKILILLLIQALLVVAQDGDQAPVPAAEEKREAMPLPEERIPDPGPDPDSEATSFCMIGTVATLPPKPYACKDANEVYACAYGEARCDGLGYCGTPPCHWR